jgi:hypothetical protein
MYTTLATRLEVNDSKTEVSQPISMEGANAAFVDFTVYHFSGTLLSVQIQGSNDLENWSDIGTAAVTASDEGYFDGSAQTPNPNPYTDIGLAYVRLSYSLSGTGVESVINAGVNTFSE